MLTYREKKQNLLAFDYERMVREKPEFAASELKRIYLDILSLEESNKGLIERMTRIEDVLKNIREEVRELIPDEEDYDYDR